jgi:cyanate lyase
VSVPTPALTRLQAATFVLAAKRAAGISWPDLAAKLDSSLVWATSALLGQQPLTAEQAATVGEVLDLPEPVVTALRLPPDRTAAAVDTSDPLVYRLTEMVQVYGAAIRELVGEEFGDGIVSAIDFEVDFARVADPKGDRAVLTLNGKFLPYRVW